MIITIAEMLINSKILFQELLSELNVDANQAEKEAMIFWVLENQLKLRPIHVMSGKEVEFDRSNFNSIIRRLNKNEPLQYVLGESEFYGRRFIVNPAVLIPRPETEIMIDSVLSFMKDRADEISILDIGTGSGCIGITLSLEVKSSHVSATDISEQALIIAKKNAKQLNASIEFYKRDVLSEFLPKDSLDVIVSNPPYILENEKNTLHENVVNYEPSLALFVPNDDALIFHRALTEHSKRSLKSGGMLMTEINERFGKETLELFQSAGFEAEIVKDLDGKDRFISGIKRTDR
ncbi:MAG: peptide chain release factor N(5)-glutamine methyltransferase [Cyclobacteriaceae bacterium]|nr:peptide chain release factor N(5)-glutamine methyltransferase [Cyclobacteriaceae bacterium]